MFAAVEPKADVVEVLVAVEPKADVVEVFPAVEPKTDGLEVLVAVEPKGDAVEVVAAAVVEPKTGSLAAEPCAAATDPNAERGDFNAETEPNTGVVVVAVDVLLEPKEGSSVTLAVDVDVVVEPKTDDLGAAVLGSILIPNGRGTGAGAGAAGVWPCLLDSAVVDCPLLVEDVDAVAGSKLARNLLFGVAIFLSGRETGGSLTRIFFLRTSVSGASVLGESVFGATVFGASLLGAISTNASGKSI